MPYYAVHTGHNPGIYMTWDAAKKEVDGYTGAVFRSCKSIKDAEYFTVHGKLPSLLGPIPSPPESSASAQTDNIMCPLPVRMVSLNMALKDRGPPETVKIKEQVKEVKEQIKVKVKATETPTEQPSELERYIKRYYTHPDIKHQESNVVHIYTDGSTISNGKKSATGGYGVFIPRTKYVKERLITRKLVNGKITNGVAELKAMTKALEEILLIDIDVDQDVELDFIIHYDSTYAADVILGTKVARVNIELVEQAQLLLAECDGLNVAFEHVYSHTGKPDLHSIGNEIADKLAAAMK